MLPHVDIDFKIIGKDMDQLKKSQPCLVDIPVFSNVPDLAPFFEEADFMVFPIFSGFFNNRSRLNYSDDN